MYPTTENLAKALFEACQAREPTAFWAQSLDELPEKGKKEWYEQTDKVINETLTWLEHEGQEETKKA